MLWFAVVWWIVCLPPFFAPRPKKTIGTNWTWFTIKKNKILQWTSIIDLTIRRLAIVFHSSGYSVRLSDHKVYISENIAYIFALHFSTIRQISRGASRVGLYCLQSKIEIHSAGNALLFNSKGAPHPGQNQFLPACNRRISFRTFRQPKLQNHPDV